MSEPLAPPPAGEVIGVLPRQEGACQRGTRAQIEFLSRVGHELRSPLNTLLGFAQILELDRSEPLTPVQKERVGQIKTAGWQLLQLINDMLDLSHIEAGQLHLSMAPLALNRVIDETVARAGTRADLRQIHLERAADPEAWVWGDEARLKQVLLSLLSSAFKNSRPDGQVELCMQARDAEHIVVSIRDHGPGMSAAQLEELHQWFNRSGPEASSIQGRGIGLVVSHKLVQRMGGELEVRSEAGCGCEFRIVLQLAHTA